jgi:FtsP/CotA-like multicopper oxidase with cupredoxin domain
MHDAHGGSPHDQSDGEVPDRDEPRRRRATPLSRGPRSHTAPRARVSVVVTLVVLLAGTLAFAAQGLASASTSDGMGMSAASRSEMAQMPTPLEMMERRVTAAQRKAAAERLKAKQALGLAPLGTSMSSLTSAGAVLNPGGQPEYFGTVANFANSPLPKLDANGNVIPGTGIRKFVDSLPGLGADAANNLGNYLPVAVPDTATFPGSDYYVIALVEYSQKLHSDLPPTKLRGYMQLATDGVTTVTAPSYMGPAIVASKNRPVRVRFINKLPTGAGGDLFIPTDTTAMGAGMGPDGTHEYTQNRATVHLHGGNTPWISDGTPHQWTTPASEMTPYPKGVSVGYVPDMWFGADGSVVPSGSADATNNPGPGELTFYYTNQQSARLMFYHDHAYGLTRLNVYAGEAAPYLLTDPTETALVEGGTVGGVPVAPGTVPSTQVPLVIQDKSFVPDDDQLAATDPTWDKAKWGGYGQLWFPHVYMPNQNPRDEAGTNAMGRWDYGPWFWPIFNPTNGVLADGSPGTPNPSLVPEGFMDTPLVNGTPYPYLKVARKAYRFRILNASNDRFLNLQLYFAKSNTPAKKDAAGNPTLQTDSGEVQMAPAVAHPGSVPQTSVYQFTSVKNGTHFYTASTKTRDALLAQRPRQWNYRGAKFSYAAQSPDSRVSVYRFLDKRRSAYIYTASTVTYRSLRSQPSRYAYTGVAWRAAAGRPAGSIPVYRFSNPYNGDCYLTASATELADLIARAKTGRTALRYQGVSFYLAKRGGPLVGGWPASWPTDGRDGGVPDPAFKGPKIVQIGTEGGLLPAAVTIESQPISYNYNRRDVVVLNIADHGLLLGPAERADVVVDFSQVPAGSKLILYNDAPAPVPAFDPRYDYYTGDPDQRDTGGAPTTRAGYGPNTRTIMQFQVDGTAASPFDFTALDTAVRAAFNASQDPIIVPQKAYGAPMNTYSSIQATSLAFTPSGASQPATITMERKAIQELFEMAFGRMNATLGTELPFTNSRQQTTLPFGYVDPVTEDIVDSGATPIAKIGTAEDGTQIWKITHNGVDTHAIHFHLFNVQVVNRVGWDGAIRPPDPNELGWKETVRTNPLEDIIVALRPVAPSLPFKIGDSHRLLDPTMPEGTTTQFFGADPLTGTPITVTNTMQNFGWEYVWHCHLLGHEENDMMRPMAFRAAPPVPASPTAAPAAGGGADLSWNNPAAVPPATGYVVQRADDASFTTGLVTSAVTAPANTWTDPTAASGATYHYRVRAENDIAYSDWSAAADVTLP